MTRKPKLKSRRQRIAAAQVALAKITAPAARRKTTGKPAMTLAAILEPVMRREAKLVRALRGLVREYDKVRLLAMKMSNLCYNLAQDPQNVHRTTMRALYIAYDQVPVTARNRAVKLTTRTK